MQQHKDLLNRAPRQPPLGQHALAERVDTPRVDLPEGRLLAELLKEIGPHRVAVVGERRRRATPVMLDVTKPLPAGIAERHRPGGPLARRRRSLWRRRQQLAQRRGCLGRRQV